MAIALVAQHAAFEDRLRQLFDKQRDTVSAGGDVREHVIG
jgi:hypothetical protein